MFTVDKYLSKRFHIDRYNCWHFVRDVWMELTGNLLYDYTPSLTTKYELELAAEDAVHRFSDVTDSVRGHESHIGGPLIVLMQQPRSTPHIGVLFGGKVLHLRPYGARWEPLGAASVGFSKVSFYTTLSIP